MDFISLALIAIRGVSTVLHNPALGGGSSASSRNVSNLLLIFSDLLEEGDEAYEEMKEFAETVAAMAAEGRSPTREERQFLRARRAAAHERYQAAKERILNPQEEPTVLDEQALETLIATLEDIPEEDRTDEENEELAGAQAELEALRNPE